MAGKRQGNILSSVFNNIEDVKNAYKQAEEAQGSAMQEQEKYEQGISYSIDRLKAKYTEFATQIVKSNVVKGVVDGASGLLDLVNLLTKSLPTLAGISAILLTLKASFTTINPYLLSSQFVIGNIGASLKIMGGTLAKFFLSNPVGICIGIATAIYGISKALNYSEDNMNKLAEKTNTLMSQYKTKIDNLNKEKTTVDNLQSRYAELSKGVNDYGENVSLSNSEFSEFKDIQAQIADLFPELITGYDEQGHAVVNLKGHVEDLSKAYDDAKDKAYNMIITGKTDDGDYTDVAENYQKQINGIHRWGSEGSSFIDDTAGYDDTLKVLNEFLNADLSTVEKFGDKYNELYEKYKNIWYSDNIKKALEGAGIKEREQLWATNDLKDEQLNGIKSLISAEVSVFNSEVDNQVHNMRSLANAFLQINSKDLDDDSKKIADKLVNNLSKDIIDSFDGSKSKVGSFVQEKIINVLKNNENLGLDYSKILEFDNSDASLDEMENQINSFVDRLSNASGISPIEIKASLNLDSVDTLKKNLADVTNQGAQHFSGQSITASSHGESHDRFDTETQKLQEFADKNSINTQDEIAFWNQCIVQSKTREEAEKKYLATDEKDRVVADKVDLSKPLSDRITKYSQDLSNFQNNMNNIKSALNSSKKLTNSELLSLQNEFPKADWQSYLNGTKSLEEVLKKLAKEDLDSLLKKCPELKSVLDGIFDDTFKKATKNIKSLTEALSDIGNKFKSLQDAYDETNEKGFKTISFDKLANLESNFGKLKSWDKFFGDATSGTASVSKLRDDMSALADEYINANGILDRLTESNKKYYISELNKLGITNADKVIEEKLAYQRKLSKKALDDLKDANINTVSSVKDLMNLSGEEIKQLYNQMKQSGHTSKALEELAKAKGIVLDEKLNTSEDNNQLDKLKNKSNDTKDAVNDLKKAKEKANETKLESNDNVDGIINTIKTVIDALKKLQAGKQNANGTNINVDGDNSNLSSTIGVLDTVVSALEEYKTEKENVNNTNLATDGDISNENALIDASNQTSGAVDGVRVAKEEANNTNLATDGDVSNENALIDASNITSGAVDGVRVAKQEANNTTMTTDGDVSNADALTDASNTTSGAVDGVRVAKEEANNSTMTTDGDVSNADALTEASNITSGAIDGVMVAKQHVNGTTIDTSADIQNLEDLANASIRAQEAIANTKIQIAKTNVDTGVASNAQTIMEQHVHANTEALKSTLNIGQIKPIHFSGIHLSGGNAKGKGKTSGGGSSNSSSFKYKSPTKKNSSGGGSSKNSGGGSSKNSGGGSSKNYGGSSKNSGGSSKNSGGSSKNSGGSSKNSGGSSKNSGGSSKNGGGSNKNGGGSNEKDDFSKEYDEIETKASLTKTSISYENNKINETTSENKKRKIYTNVKKYYNDLLSTYKSGKKYYLSEMKKIKFTKLEKYIADNVANGAISISTITDEKLANKIDKYVNLSKKASDCQVEIQNCNNEIIKNADLINDLDIEAVDRQLSKLSYEQSKIQNKIDQNSAKGLAFYKSFSQYKKLYENNDNRITQLQKENELLEEQNKGIAHSSQEYQDNLSKIRSNKLEIQNCELNQIKWNAELANIQTTKIDEYIDKLKVIYNLTESIINLKKADGSVKESDYVSQYKQNTKSESEYNKEAKLYQYYAELRKNGKTPKLTYDIQRKIADILGKKIGEIDNVEWTAILQQINSKSNSDWIKEANQKLIEVNNLKQANIEIKKAIRELRWSKFNTSMTNLTNSKNEFTDLKSFINTNNLYDKDGKLTKDGLAQIGLDYEIIDKEQQTITKARDGIATLNKELKAHNITQEQYDSELNTFLATIKESAKNIYTLKNEIVDMYVAESKNNYQEEADKLKELITLRQDALSSKEAYYEYDKTIREKNKDINSIKAQITVLEGVEDLNGKATLERLKSELKEKQDDLDDTKHQHSIEMQSKGYEKLSKDVDDNLQKTLDSLEESAKNIEEIFAKMTKSVTKDYKDMFKSIQDILTKYNIPLSPETFDDLQKLYKGNIKITDKNKPGNIVTDDIKNINTNDITKTVKKEDNIDTTPIDNISRPNSPYSKNFVKSVKMNKSSITLYLGESYKLTYKLNPSDVGNPPAHWDSSNSKIAEVYAGHVYASKKKTGTCKITVEVQGKKSTCKVTVKKKSTKKTNPKTQNKTNPKTQNKTNPKKTNHKYKPSTIKKTLSKGSKGSDVKTLQHALNELGFKDYNKKSLAYDGSFGARTLYALKAFQKKYKVKQSGKLDSSTKKAFGKIGYAKGLVSAKEDEIAKINELGSELIVRVNGQDYTYLTKDSGVIPANLTKNLMEFGKYTPNDLISKALKQNTLKENIQKQDININIGNILNVEGNVDNQVVNKLSNISNNIGSLVTNMFKKELNKFGYK